MHTFALKPGENPEDFEKCVLETVYALTEPEGVKHYLLKGDRGDREGKYLWVFEVDSIEPRDRYYPP